MPRHRHLRRRVAALCAAALGVGFVPMVATAPSAGAAPTDLIISEYVEALGDNKALEFYNGTGSAIDLAAGEYSVQMFFNGSATAGLTIDLTGSVAAGDVYVLAHELSNGAVLVNADQRNGGGWFSGDDAIVLRKGTTVLDSIGQVGVDPGTEWGSGLTSTMDNTLRRKAAVEAGDTVTTDQFDPATEWDGFPVATYDGLGSHEAQPQPPSAVCADPFTVISAIQGSGAAAAVTGLVATEGVVVGDFEGPSPALRGFYLQDPQGDGDAATSDAIFVFNGNDDDVSLGDHVRVVGAAGEFQDQTQISGTSSVAVCGQGTVAPTAISFPVASPTFLERYEGMLVTVPEPMTVTEHFQLGRFGQVVVSSEGRLQQPTNVVEPGAEALVLQAANNNRRLIIDDSSQAQNPDPIVWGRDGQPLSASNTLRGGDTVSGATGVLTYTWAGNSASANAYRLRPIGALGGGAQFQAANPRPTSGPAVGGTVQVSAMNLLNFFNTFDGLPDQVDNCTFGIGGAPADCRGADTQVEFDRQWPKTVAAIRGTGAEVVGVNEIENDGYGSDSALAFLTARLNDADGAGTWAYLDVDARTGETNALGTDAIKVGMLYKPRAVTPVGDTGALNSDEFVNGGDSAARSRPALAQALRDRATGGVFTVVVNHLKSKGSACDTPAANDGQGNCNSVRLRAARALAAWLETDPTGTGDEDVLIMGDLNSYAKEDPVRALEAAGYTNLIADRLGPDAYSYVFDGQWGYLDHALGSASITRQVVGVADWHINADEPSVLDYNTDFKSAGQIESLYAPDEFRISDHDPVIVGLKLDRSTPLVTGGGTFPAARGLAVFGLVATYAKGAATPTGTFTLVAPGRIVQATGMDWLVVAGDRARLVGPARVNGQSGHRVEVVTIDRGRSDTIHVVVTKASGEVVLDSGVQTVRGQVVVRE